MQQRIKHYVFSNLQKNRLNIIRLLFGLVTLYSPIHSNATVTKNGCHAVMMTWRPICLCTLRYALTKGLVVAARCPTTQSRITMSSTHLLSYIGRLAALSLTTECQDHSRRLRLERLLTEGCNPASGRRSSSETQDMYGPTFRLEVY